MLVLTRKPGERILIGENVVLHVVRVKPNQVRLGIEAPPEVTIFREEIVGKDKKPKVSVKKVA